MASSLSEVQKCVLLSSAGATTLTSASSAPSPSAERSCSPEIGSATRARIFRPIGSAVAELGHAARAPVARRVALHRALLRAPEALERRVQDETPDRHGEDDADDDDGAA